MSLRCLRFTTLALCLAFVAFPSGAAGRLTVLYKFGGVGLYGVTRYGRYSASSLQPALRRRSRITDANGALYGAAQGGGLGNCSHEGCGTVFKLTP